MATLPTQSGGEQESTLSAKQQTNPFTPFAQLLRRFPWLWTFACLAISVFGVVFVWHVGHKGVCFYDQSGVFDGAWRLIQGQVPYRDFYTPYGPVVFWIQSLFFRLAGVDFSSMVLSAAVVNGLAVLCVIRLVVRLFPDDTNRVTALAAGLLTSVWFQAPFGTLWFEQTSFLFNLFAMVLLVEAGSRSHRTAMYLRMAAGCLLAIAVLSKQTAGFILLPVPLGVALLTSLPNLRRMAVSLIEISAGMLFVGCVFAIWLWTISSPAGFWQSVIVMSRELGSQRASQVPGLISLLLLQPTWKAGLPPVIAFAVFAGSSGAFATRSRILASWIVISYIFLQNMFAALTLQDVGNSLGFSGLINGLSFGLLVGAFWKKRRPEESLLPYCVKYAVPLVAILLLFYYPGRRGYWISSGRVVQQFESGSRFDERLNVPGMARVSWGNPTVVRDANVTRTDFENLNAWLESANANFVVFSDTTVLYGLHRRVSPQPWVYFMRDHSFLMSNIAQVDKVVLDSLIKNKVKIIVREKVSWGEDVKVLEAMPALQTWIRTNFAPAADFGIYEVLKMQPSN